MNSSNPPRFERRRESLSRDRPYGGRHFHQWIWRMDTGLLRIERKKGKRERFELRYLNKARPRRAGLPELGLRALRGGEGQFCWLTFPRMSETAPSPPN